MKIISTVLSLVVAAIAVAFFVLPRSGKDVLVLATTTSTENSGLLASIHPDFEKRTGIRVKVIAKGTGASLRLARDGNADAVLVHAKEQEEKFEADGCGIGRRRVCRNDFVILGPKEDKAGIRGMKDAAAAFRKIAERREIFVSRGDNSGTHYKEQFLWKESGVALETRIQDIIEKGKKITVTMRAPAGGWYHSIGRGMSGAVNYASEKRAYVLCDRGTYYALADHAETDHVILCEGDARLYNPYHVMAVSPDTHPHVNHRAAKKYIEWITSPETQKLIGEYTRGGKVLFHPAGELK